MKINPNEKGFALILTLFLVIALTLITAGNMLTMERQQRSVQRMIDRVKLAWAAEAVIDRTFKQFNDYIRAHGFPPADQSGVDWLVYDDSDGGKDLFQTKLATWFQVPFQFSKTGAAIRFEGLQHLNLDRVMVLADPGTKDELYRRLYEIKVKVSNALTQVRAEYSQKIEIKTGRLFDYGVFYNSDLEIGAGPNWELQGPIFANGDIFLMNNPGSTLTLKMPDQATHPEYYALRSAGNVYFYFKTAIAENYFLKNNKYRAAVPDFYKTDQPSHPLYSAGTNGVEVYAGPTIHKTLGYVPPYVYVFWNKASYGGASAHTVRVRKSDGSFVTLLPPTTPIATYEATCDYASAVPYALYASGGGAVGNNLNVSAAIERQPEKARKLLPGWTAAQPKSTSPMVNPQWAGFQEGMVGDRFPSQALPVGGKDLDPHILIEPLALDGDENGDGKKDATDVRIRKYKYQTYGNMVFKCKDSACESYSLFVSHGNDPAAPASEIIFDGGTLGGDSLYGVSLKEDFYDYRMKRAVRYMEISLQSFLNKIKTSFPDIDFKTYRTVIYVETASTRPGAVQGVAPVIVKIREAEKIPAKGLSVVTNGRVWVQGNYNIYPYDASNEPLATACTFSEIQSGSCDTPPADFYSDSFGVLSVNWNSGRETLVNSLLASRAASDTILNAAVVTGYLPSQLVKPFKPKIYTAPECDLSTEPVESQPNRAPCYYYHDDQFLGAEAVTGKNFAVKDSNDLYFVNQDTNYFLALKAKNTEMAQAGSTFRTFVDKPNQVYTSTARSCYREVASGAYACGAASVNPATGISVKTYLMPQEYFRDLNPVGIPIAEAIQDTTSGEGLWSTFVYHDGISARPFPTMGYPGINFRRLPKGYLDNALKYSCIKNTDVSYNYTRQTASPGVTTCVPPANEGPPVCTTTGATGEWRHDSTGTSYSCKCGAQYNRDDGGDQASNKENKVQQPEASYNFLGSGLCPNQDDNYFTSYPSFNYTWKGYGSVWEAKYSGGLENIINFQESWYDGKGTAAASDDTQATLHFRGSLVSGWDSKELIKTDGTPAFFGTSYYYYYDVPLPYYNAPIRDYSFNDRLRNDPPPLPESSGMLLFSIARKSFREEALEGAGESNV